MFGAIIIIFVSKAYSFDPFSLGGVKREFQDAADKAAIIDTGKDLLEEAIPDEDPTVQTQKLSQKIRFLQKTQKEYLDIGEDGLDVFRTDDRALKNTESSLKSATTFIKRFKRFVTRLGTMSSQGATAASSLETNMALNQVNKNLSQILIQDTEFRVSDREERTLEKKKMEDFLLSQRKIVAQGSLGQKNGR